MDLWIWLPLLLSFLLGLVVCFFFLFLLLYCPFSPSHRGDVHNQPSIQFSMLCLGSKGQEVINWSAIYPTLLGFIRKKRDPFGGQGLLKAMGRVVQWHRIFLRTQCPP